MSLITSVCQLGAAIGAIISGSLGGLWGKKTCFHISNLLLIIGCSLTLIKVKEIVLVGRFIFGFAVGSFSVFVPGFINELSPTELKGSLGAST